MKIYEIVASSTFLGPSLVRSLEARFVCQRGELTRRLKLRQNCSHIILYPPTTKKHLNFIAKENLIEPSLLNKLGPYEFSFLDKENKSVKKNFDEVI